MLDRGIAIQRRVFRDLGVDLQRLLRLLEGLVQVGERQQRQRVVRRQIDGKLQIQQTEVLAAAAPERRSDAVQRLGPAARGFAASCAVTRSETAMAERANRRTTGRNLDRILTSGAQYL